LGQEFKAHFLSTPWGYFKYNPGLDFCRLIGIEFETGATGQKKAGRGMEQ
jgi:hypothetical protein